MTDARPLDTGADGSGAGQIDQGSSETDVATPTKDGALDASSETKVAILTSDGALDASAADEGSGALIDAMGSSCTFTISSTTLGTKSCTIPAGSQNACGQTARCLCADRANVEACVADYLSWRGAPTLTDFCPGPADSTPGSFADAIGKFAAFSGATVTVSPACDAIPALLAP